MRFVRCLVLFAICGFVVHARPSATAAAMRGPLAAGDHAIAQIAPGAHADPDLAVMEPFGEPRSRRSRKPRAGAGASQRTLADALIEPTDAENRDLIKQFGLPMIEGVPPVHMLFPADEDHRPPSGF